MDNVEFLKANLRQVPDFPIKGIMFWDITTMFKNPECLHILKSEMYNLYKDKGITKVVGLESRGFPMGAVIADSLDAGFVFGRKMGKLPSDSIQQRYQKEYGHDTIEIHRDAITEDDVVLIHDDLLATGGTMEAARQLVEKFHPKAIYINFIIEIEFLAGRNKFPKGVEVTSIIKV